MTTDFDPPLDPSASPAGPGAPSSSPGDAAGDEAERSQRLEARLARLEAQVRALQEYQAEVGKGERSRKQNALIFRLVLLAVLLGLFFLVQSRGVS